ncbi:SPOSA6832_00023 [Sporobolomyces salmonicolor]|uniref:SPOSA6832_00023-mRNA-1:cds n=1 Tax=Sporidiobolus salmonicolor TaxID=5005 RepID=A0A0D6EF91_SPOSA|nr:SPOSA6832_00023 [Sporobolomyces salmonicolor]
MRSHLLISLTFSLLLTLAAARAAPLDDSLNRRDPSPQRAGERVGIAFGRPDALLLITLERTVTNAAKDKILDVLLRSGAIVKQVYDYRVRARPPSFTFDLPHFTPVSQVFKGVLFTIPSSSDKGLTSWQSALGKQEGVKYVEEDSVVKIQ